MILKKIKIIFIFLISHVLSVYYIKNKHGSVKVTTKEGIVYLNADNFKKNDKIHILIKAFSSKVDDKIYYEFSDNIPKDNFKPTNSKKPDITWSGVSTDGEEEKNYYDIKKDISAKYLIIKYTGYYKYKNYNNGYLKIENILINWGIFLFVFIICIVTLPILIFFICFCCCYIFKRKKIQKTNNNYENLEQKVDINHESNNKENVNTNDNSNDNIGKQQNFHYEPPNIDNVDTINDSN